LVGLLLLLLRLFWSRRRAATVGQTPAARAGTSVLATTSAMVGPTHEITTLAVETLGTTALLLLLPLLNDDDDDDDDDELCAKRQPTRLGGAAFNDNSKPIESQMAWTVYSTRITPRPAHDIVKSMSQSVSSSVVEAALLALHVDAIPKAMT
jgi:hypothetical protein